MTNTRDEKLKKYLSEIKKYPALRENEEKKLALRIQLDNDDEAKNILARSNLQLVVDIAKRYIGIDPNYTLMDLIREGNLGLFKAVERYGHKAEYRFSAYATWWIRQAITRKLPQY